MKLKNRENFYFDNHIYTQNYNTLGEIHKIKYKKKMTKRAVGLTRSRGKKKENKYKKKKK